MMPFVVAALYAVLLEAAVETVRTNAPVRLFVLASLGACTAAAAITWRNTTWSTKAWLAGFALIATFGVSAWLPGGLTDGVRLLGLPTIRALPLLAAAGVALAGAILMRVPKVPIAARWAFGALTVYAVAAFVHGAATGVPLTGLLAGQGLWQALPIVSQGAVLGGLVVLPVAVLTSVATLGLRPPRDGTLARSIREACAMALMLSIVIAALPQWSASNGAAASASSGAAAQTPAERLATLENSFRALEDGLRESPRDRWDPDYVVQQVGTDPQRLFEWVRDHTSWIPYRGVLRGAVGVLNDRLGNSLDRAVLLATLLEKAGHTVRLAHRQLNSRQAIEMVSAALTGPPLSEALTDDLQDPPSEDDVAKAGAQYGLNRNAIGETLAIQLQAAEKWIADLDGRVEDHTRRLLTMIEPYDAATEWQQRIDQALDAVRDHWWVQRQRGDTWVDLDTVEREEAVQVATQAAPDTLTLRELAPLHHEVVLRVVAERADDRARSEHALIEHSLRPAELHGQAIAVQFWPASLRADGAAADGDPVSQFRATMLEETLWDVALMIGRDVVAQASVTASGQAPKGPKGGPMGVLGQSLSRVLSGDPSSDDGTLTAVWLEYEIRSPGQMPRRIRRDVFDLIGPAARAANAATPVLSGTQRLSRSLSLMMRTEILPLACSLASEFVEHLAARSLLADREIFHAALLGEFSQSTIASNPLLKGAAPALTPLYSLAVARMEWSRYADQLVVDRLNVLTRHRFLALRDGSVVMRDAVDIVANEVGVELAAPDAFAVRVEQGALDTSLEQLLLGSVGARGNTADAFTASSAWTSIHAADDAARLAVPDDARRRMLADLESGNTVVAPTAVRDGLVSWWRIDRGTGHTLGIGPNGWGQAMVERGVQYNVFTEMASRFVFDYLLCQAIPVVVEAARPMVTDLFGTPSWVTPPSRQKSSHELYEENFKGCLVSAIASGAAFATLPLLLATLKYVGRSVFAVLRELARDVRGPKIPGWRPKMPGRPPRPPSKPATQQPKGPKVQPCGV
jgi:hypothetical protein